MKVFSRIDFLVFYLNVGVQFKKLFGLLKYLFKLYFEDKVLKKLCIDKLVRIAYKITVVEDTPWFIK